MRKQPNPCLDHAPFQDERVVHTLLCTGLDAKEVVVSHAGIDSTTTAVAMERPLKRTGHALNSQATISLRKDHPNGARVNMLI